MGGDIFHSHRCRNQSLIVASTSDTTLIEGALYRIGHTNAEIVLIRRACYLICYLKLAYFIALYMLVHSVVVQRRLISNSIRLEGADRVGIRLLRKLCVLDLRWRDIFHLHAIVVLHLLAAICRRTLLSLIKGLFHFW